MLNNDQKNVLLALIHNPTFKINAIKSYLDSNSVKISYYAIKKAYEELHTQNILRNEFEMYDTVVPGNKRKITAVEGNYIPEKLGLVRQHVIFRELPNKIAVDKFNDICDLHPYTHYRTLLIGRGMNAYAQFDIPYKISGVMNEFYSEIVTILGCVNFEVINAIRTTHSKLKLDKYIPENNQWDFHVFGENSFESIWKENLNEQNNEFVSSSTKPLLNELKDIDFQLIRELTINANVKAADIHNHYNKDRTTISRHLSRISNNILHMPALYYNRIKFDLSSPQMIIGKVKSARDINQLHSIYKTGKFPFRSELVSENSKFIMILMVPPSLAPEISYFIWSIIPSIEIFSISVSIDTAKKYPFYNENFDLKNKCWKMSKEYILDDVLKKYK